MAKAKTAEPKSEASLPESVMNPEIMTFKIKGISPLLQNNPAEFIGKTEADEMTRTKKVYNDEDEASARTYKADDGTYQHPSESFVKAMVKAVGGMKIGKASARSKLMGSVFIAEPFCTIMNGDGKPAKTYAIDRRPVVIGKARVLRCRPMWTNWSTTLALDVDTALVQRHQVVQCLSLAGRTIGIGDYRPEKGGGFGRFTVE